MVNHPRRGKRKYRYPAFTEEVEANREMVLVPRILSRRRPPNSGFRDPTVSREKINTVREQLRAMVDRLPERDREFARSLVAARNPTTRQLFFMENLIRQQRERDEG